MRLAYKKNYDLKKLPEGLGIVAEGLAVATGIYVICCAACYAAENICECVPDFKTIIYSIYEY